MNVRIVPMDASHLDALAQIEQECFSLPWSRSMLEEELYNDCAAFLVCRLRSSEPMKRGLCWVMQGCRWSWTRAILPTWWCGRDTGAGT